MSLTVHFGANVLIYRRILGTLHSTAYRPMYLDFSANNAQHANCVFAPYSIALAYSLQRVVCGLLAASPRPWFCSRAAIQLSTTPKVIDRGVIKLR
jgi:hypothetical protein